MPVIASMNTLPYTVFVVRMFQVYAFSSFEVCAFPLPTVTVL